MPRRLHQTLIRLESERKDRLNQRLPKVGDELTRAYNGFQWPTGTSQKEVAARYAQTKEEEGR
jgi:hypothetical protein